MRLDRARGGAGLDRVAIDGLAAAVRSSPVDIPQLSAQELKVLGQVAEGRTNPDIAAVLHLAPSTVKTYLDRVFTKLGVRDRAGAVGRAKDLKLF